ncbi:hypothetical protein [Plebeiibacterium sediminum]|uniref:UspA domain-containing protein n=1 Tax=Plebeiibacterium sediminum TaxID=2992112 RepID=A0AAE3M181_9BACT|nr:hypothetical protein [Plebeiobacterium sediminum]MCW3784895.1 hypothetical protein [Plebeiobacterium sediminum]
MRRKIIEYINTTKNIEEAIKTSIHLGNKLNKDIELNIVVENAAASSLAGATPLTAASEAQIQQELLLEISSKAKEVVNKYEKDTADLNIEIKQSTSSLDYLIKEKSREKDTYLIILAQDSFRVDVSLLSFFDKFAQLAECPILRLPSDYTFKPFNRILYASDFLEEDIEKLKNLINIAKVFRSHITMLHISEKEDSNFRNTLDFANDIVQQIDYENIEVKTISSRDISTGINNYAHNNKYDLVVVLREHKNFFENIIQKSQSLEITKDSEKAILMFHELN